MNKPQNHLSRPEQTTRSTHSHQTSLHTAPSTDQNHQQKTTETPSAEPTQQAIRTTSENSLGTPYSTGIKEQNRKANSSHTLACLLNRSGGPSDDGLAGGCTGGAQ